MTGTVIRFRNAPSEVGPDADLRGFGFGFIQGDDSENYFVHVNALLGNVKPRALFEGDYVSFDPIPDTKGRGLRAAHLDVLERAEPNMDSLEPPLEEQ